jgi:uncharacterized protein (DUF488 family)
VNKIATIGFGKKSAERFVDLLRSAGVTTVIDTRRRPDSPLSGYARKRDLPFLLREAGGISYEHWLELAPPDDLLQQYRQAKDWSHYVNEFEARVLGTQEARNAMTRLLERNEIVALLCSEPTPEKCHRRLVVERMQEIDPKLDVVHLV